MQRSTEPTKARGRQFRTVRDAIWHCERIKGSAKFVAIRLVEHYNPDREDAFPSLQTLGKFTGLSERTVRDAIRELERKRIIETRRTGRNNVYSLAFVGVSIPELGGDSDDGDGGDVPSGEDAPPESGGREAQSRQNLPVLPADHTPAESAAQTGSFRRSDRQELPPKQEAKLKEKRRGRRAGAPNRRTAAPPPPPALFTSWFGWKLSPELRAELIAAGIPADRVDNRVLKFKNRPIRRRGVPSLDDYIREQIPLWLRWEGEAMPNSGAGNGVSSADGGSRRPGGHSSSADAPAGRPGRKWIHVRHVAFARSAGLDVHAEAERFRETYYQGPTLIDGMAACDLYAPFMDHLKRAAAAASEAA